MKRENHISLILAAMTAMLTLGTGLSLADDTEIFEATPPTGADNRPNVLLIIDTSGSMDGDVITQVDWDPTVTYAGDGDDTCSTSRIYWQSSSSTETPSCDDDNEQWIDRSKFVCQAAAANLALSSGTGQVTLGETLQWKGGGTKSWVALKKDRNTYVECRADHPETGTHSGLVANDNQFARDGNNGPFSGSNPITNWGSASYTFYTGNRLNYLRHGSTTTKTRLQVVQASSKDMLDGLIDGTVNVGLMRYSQDSGWNTQGGYVMHAMGPIEDVRSAIKAQIDTLTPDSWTPLTETLFEAWRYYTGGEVYFGNDVGDSYSVAGSRQTLDTDLYRSPLANSCQTNYIVFLSDGEATRDSSADSLITDLSGFSSRSAQRSTSPITSAPSCSAKTGGGGDSTGICFDDLAEYMYVRPDIAAAEDKIGKKIQTFTIGFGPDVAGSSELANAALYGGGKAYTAGDSATLAAAFSNVLRQIISTNVTFTSPTISVNAFNRTRNLNDLFFTVFQPTDAFHWPGNIKKYRIREDGLLVGADGLAAVDTATGFFAKTAQSFWTTGKDGDDVSIGGAAHELPNGGSAPGTGLRNVYTDIAAYGGSPVTNLAATNNAFSTGNTAITGDATLLGLDATATSTEVNELITWARGQMPDGTQRYEVGDPLHSRPAAVTYGGTATAPDLTVYAATNDGYLHAIDPDDGSELWTFVPSELLPRLADLRASVPTASKPYGIDGSIVVYQTDTGIKGVVDGTDKVILYFGMGRGGSNYYAVDVTDRANPTLLWRNGASGTMTNLGQSWSTPNIVTVKVDTTPTVVMIVAGGYDTTQDTTIINTDDRGNRLFMLNAMTGAVIWRAGPTNVTGLGYDSAAQFTDAKMAYSIPSEVRVIDTGTDGLADRMYVGDMGGQLWRFDIINGQPAASLVRGGVIASLGAASGSGATVNTANSRRFYAPPDVAFLTAGSNRYLNIAIGSGYRGHPLNTETRDRFYSLRDSNPVTAMSATDYSSYSVLTDTTYNASTNPTGLFDLTTVSAITETTPPVVPNTVAGWKLRLRDSDGYEGEKVLAESRTFGGWVYFTTFTPNNTVAANSCTVRSGSNKLYAVCLSGSCIRKEFVLKQAGIAPEPVIIRPTRDPNPPCAVTGTCPPLSCTGAACDKPRMLIGAESVDAELFYESRRIFWKATE
jgi:type IV pilus assembly protein PilY1